MIPKSQLYPDAIFENIPIIDQEIHLYPQPAVSVLKILFSNTNIISDGQYQILSMNGSLIEKGIVEKGREKLLIEIDVNDYIPGAYFFKLMTGDQRQVFPFIKIM